MKSSNYILDQLMKTYIQQLRKYSMKLKHSNFEVINVILNVINNPPRLQQLTDKWGRKEFLER